MAPVSFPVSVLCWKQGSPLRAEPPDSRVRQIVRERRSRPCEMRWMKLGMNSSGREYQTKQRRSHLTNKVVHSSRHRATMAADYYTQCHGAARPLAARWRSDGHIMNKTTQHNGGGRSSAAAMRSSCLSGPTIHPCRLRSIIRLSVKHA